MAAYTMPSMHTPGAALGAPISSSKRVYIGNLSYRTSWMTLKDFFRAECGPVVRCDVAVDETKLMPGGRPCSKGWGVVEFQSEVDAAKALQLTDSVIDDRPIFVREDREASTKTIPNRAPRAGPMGAMHMTPAAQAAAARLQNGRAMPMAGGFARNRSRSRGGKSVGSVTRFLRMAAYTMLSMNAPGAALGVPISNSKRVYVGNLSYRTSWMTLKDFFRAECGPVVRCDVAVDETKLMPGGRPCSKGWGVVQFQSEVDAAKALQLTDSIIDDRPIFVREDREDSTKTVPSRAPRPSPVGAMHMTPAAQAAAARLQNGRAMPMAGGFARNRSRSRGGGKGGVGKPVGGFGKRLYVGNLAFTVSWQDLKDHFKVIGPIRDATVATDGTIGTRPKSRGFGFVEFFKPEDHERALQVMTDTEIGGRKIWVREDRDL
eukprot:CAMPEP_0204303932 /NCGR_PEP_ID=MMETSP0468-20130131/84157_1 /ASSEMBLY_ACC=CAM_ASM_000383 /TAXON_ID=2969 /ORGANISM="Oxyrrhis marina" /LENGTH=431 /DNA_ID=CAMNT_0051283251 /DNA_START=28 /DNA_END=1323 /DNA_ORIENTATION=+